MTLSLNQFRETSRNKMHDGWQYVLSHASSQLQCDMNIGVYLPPQAVSADGDAEPERVPALLWLSGLTCSEQNFVTKAGGQKLAAVLGMAIICPDTSPRGEDVADDESYDLGQGAGFYINATQSPWAKHYQMEDYLLKEVLPRCEAELPLNGQWSISGHSMGGHGALTLYLKYPQQFAACSAFSPICAPTQVPWGQKAFSTYLGEDRASWAAHDATALIKAGKTTAQEILIDQGRDDNFLNEQLKPELFAEACQQADQAVNIRMQSGYDHSYYFIASFIDDHLEFHYNAMASS